MLFPNNKKPLISVVVPVYNAESTLNKCVDSIINQSYKNLEIILVNDGSTDNSLEICKNYKSQDERFVIIDKENSGPAAARNAALKIASGDYISFVDSDDWVDEKMIENLISNMIQHESQISVCKVCQVYGNIKVEFNKNSEVFSLGKTKALGLLFDSDWGLYSCNKLFKKDLFNNVVYPANRYFEDNYTIYKLFLKAEKVTFDTGSYYYYLQRKNSTTHVYSIEIMNDEIPSYEEIYKLKEFNEHKNKIRKLIVHALTKYYDNNKKVLEKDKKENEKFMKWVKEYCDFENLSKKEKLKLSVHKNFNWIFVLRYKISANSGLLYGFIKKLIKN